MRKFLRGIGRNLSILLVITFLLGSNVSRATPTLSESFPRLANYYLKSPVTLAEARQLAKWDVVILGLELTYTSPLIFPTLRELNPDILLLAYAPSEEMPVAHRSYTDENHPHTKLARGVPEGWWLTNAGGGRVSNWPGTEMLNVTLRAPVIDGKQWNTYLPQFLHDEVVSTGLWDGIFYDNVWPDISWLNGGDIDLDSDGRAEPAAELDTAWREGMASLLMYSRRLEGDEAIIIGNGGGQYYTSMNGRLIEDFPSEADGGWKGAMERYVDVMQRGHSPALVVLNGKSTTGESTDYQGLRFALASALLDDGFLSFDYGTQRHSDLWWYDEYAVALGAPVSERANQLDASSTTIKPGLWRRDFENGIVLLNSTETERTVTLADAFEAIAGSQASLVNDGDIVTSVTLPPLDGMLLLRRQFTVLEGQYENGVFARSFTADGTPTRQAFFTYDDDVEGGAQIVKRDLDGDHEKETIAAIGPTVQVSKEDGTLMARFFPYGQSYRRSVTIAVGDVTGDGKDEIVTGAGAGGGPHVRVFTTAGRALHPGFFAYNQRFRGGVNVAVGDVNGDGVGEIVTGTGKRGGPHVRIFTMTGKPLGGFFAYSSRFRGGVDVAVGDVTGDGKDEIVTGAGAGGGPHVRIFGGTGQPALPGFFAFDPDFRGGIAVSVLDINNDLRQDILASINTVY